MWVKQILHPYRPFRLLKTQTNFWQLLSINVFRKQMAEKNGGYYICTSWPSSRDRRCLSANSMLECDDDFPSRSYLYLSWVGFRISLRRYTTIVSSQAIDDVSLLITANILSCIQFFKLFRGRYGSNSQHPANFVLGMAPYHNLRLKNSLTTLRSNKQYLPVLCFPIRNVYLLRLLSLKVNFIYVQYLSFLQPQLSDKIT
jgi:hypothetical protein